VINEADSVECRACHSINVPMDDDEWFCLTCTRERDEHPAWQAIQRVERGETTVRRRGDLGNVTWWGHCWLETSDGWLFEIYFRGEPFTSSGWRCIESMKGPDGTVYEDQLDTAEARRDPARAHLPVLIWMYWDPIGPVDAKRWALLPSGWTSKPGAQERARRNEWPR
jgi:hypothetical protein